MWEDWRRDWAVLDSQQAVAGTWGNVHIAPVAAAQKLERAPEVGAEGLPGTLESSLFSG